MNNNNAVSILIRIFPSFLLVPSIHYNKVPGLPGFLSLSYFFISILIYLYICREIACTGFTLKKLSLTDILLVVFVIINLLTVPFSIEPMVSIKTCFELLTSLFLYFIIAKTHKSTYVNDWLYGLLISVFFVSVLAIVQFATNSSWGMSSYLNDITESERINLGDSIPSKAIGTFLHGNSLAIYLTMTLPIILGLALQNVNRRIPLHLLFIFTIGVFSLIVSQSRGGNLSFIFALIFMWILSRKKNTEAGNTLGKYKRIIICGAILIVAAYFLGLGDILKERFFSSTFSERDNASNFSRVINLIAGVNAVTAHPFVGIGPGVSGKHFVDFGGWTGLGPHNLYLFIASERGIPALIVFLLAIILFLKKSVTVFRQQHIMILGWSLTGIIAVLINGFFESILTDIFMPFFFASLGILSYYTKHFCYVDRIHKQ